MRREIKTDVPRPLSQPSCRLLAKILRVSCLSVEDVVLTPDLMRRLARAKPNEVRRLRLPVEELPGLAVAPWSNQLEDFVEWVNELPPKQRARIVLIPQSDINFAIHTARLASQTELGTDQLLSDLECRQVAEELGLQFDPDPEIDLPVRALLSLHPPALAPDRWGYNVTVVRDGTTSRFLAPSTRSLPHLCRMIAKSPKERQSVVVTTPQAIKDTMRQPYAESRVGRAASGLLAGPKQLSAKTCTKLKTKAVILSVALATLVVSWALPVLIHVLAGFAMLLNAGVRLGAVWHITRDPQKEPDNVRIAEEHLPVYTVLVPLYDEAQMVPDLIAALSALDYPPDKLDVKFVLEHRDRATLAALRSHQLPSYFDVLRVPHRDPLTKPKALNYAFQFARGELVTVYDAEDRPDPMQLRQAAARFHMAGRQLACLQCKLVIDHPNETWITRMFALEYGCLFGCILPFLSRCRINFPLGGTSNHFRASALRAIGAWDPYNVTEDADLGIRLTRQGYRMELLPSNTYEEAPVSLDAWFGQRSRWFKGWLQTLVVHLRPPNDFVRDVGRDNALAVAALLIGGLFGIALHPVFLLSLYGTLIFAVPWGAPATSLQMLVFGFDCVVFLVGYGGAILLAEMARRRQHAELPWYLPYTLPFYWMLMGIALLIAVADLIRAPSDWNKTVHGRAKQREWRSVSSL